jgi:uncharacterized protein YyaL (SSP411 family)
MIKNRFVLPALLPSLLILFGIGFVTASIDTDIKPVKVKAKTAQNGEVKTLNWLDFESGYAKAVKENKMLLIDVYTDWCGWCKVMDRTTYSNDTVIDLINASFVAVKLNPEKDRTYTFGDTSMKSAELHRWLGYGQTFGYPTTYFMVAPGKRDERYAQVGYMEAAEFAGILQMVLDKK